MISIDTNSEYTMDRRWNIRIQQLPCDSTYKGMHVSYCYNCIIVDTISTSV